MATPASGAIAATDFNTEVKRVTSTTTISMNEMRTRLGIYTNSISFSELRKSEGFTITCGNSIAAATKFSAAVDADGYANSVLAPATIGSVSPGEVNSYVQFAANSFLVAFYQDNTIIGSANSYLLLAEAPTTLASNSAAITTGYRGTDVSRLIISNNSITINSSSSGQVVFPYNVPISGTLSIVVRF